MSPQGPAIADILHLQTFLVGPGSHVQAYRMFVNRSTELGANTIVSGTATFCVIFYTP